MLNNYNLGLIRQAELGYEMDYAVDLGYDAGAGEELGIDHVKMMESMGCTGRRVEKPGDIAEALAWGRKQVRETKRPVLVEILIERDANAAMGPAIDKIKEFEELPALEEEGEGVLV
jgi:tartronate-semialdehyde synthase